MREEVLELAEEITDRIEKYKLKTRSEMKPSVFFDSFFCVKACPDSSGAKRRKGQ